MKAGDRYPSNAKATPSEEKLKKALTEYTEPCIIITTLSRGAGKSKGGGGYDRSGENRR